MIFSNGKALRAEPEFYVRNVIVKENTPQWVSTDNEYTWKKKESFYVDTHLMYRDDFITCLSRSPISSNEAKDLKKALANPSVSKVLENKTTPSFVECYLLLAVHRVKKGLRNLTK